VVRPHAAPEAAWWRAAAIAASALVLAFGTLASIWLLARPLALLFAAIAIAEALSPLVARLETRLPRPIAVTIVYLGLSLVLATLGWLVVPRLVDQAQDFADRTPEIVQRLRSTVNEWDPNGSDRIVNAIEQNVDRFSGVLLGLPFAIASSLLQIVLVLFMSAYWLLSAPSLGRFVRQMFPPRLVPKVDTVLDDMGQSIGGYVRGEVIDAIAVGAVTYLGLELIGVDYPIVLAVVAGLGELVPVVGPLIAAIPAVAVGFVDSPGKGLIVVAFYVGLQQFESNILLPHTMHHTAGVPPLLAIFALFAGASLGGLLGALVAIPLAGALKVLMTNVVAPAVRHWSGRDGQAAANHASVDAVPISRPSKPDDAD
jgi:predicted PurR-regulated permease PerM